MMICHFTYRIVDMSKSIGKFVCNIYFMTWQAILLSPSLISLFFLYFSLQQTPHVPPLYFYHKPTSHYESSYPNAQFVSITVLIQILLRILQLK